MSNDTKIPEWLKAFREELARDVHEDQERYIHALDATFVEVKRFFEQTKLPKE